MVVTSGGGGIRSINTVQSQRKEFMTTCQGIIQCTDMVATMVERNFNESQCWSIMNREQQFNWMSDLSLELCVCVYFLFFFQNLCGARLHLTRSPFLSSIIYFWFFFNFNEHLQSDTCLFFLLCCHIKFNHIFFQLYVNKSD